MNTLYSRIMLHIWDREGCVLERTVEISVAQYETMLQEYHGQDDPFLRFEGKGYRSPRAEVDDDVMNVTLVPADKTLN